jgi:nitroreductase
VDFFDVVNERRSVRSYLPDMPADSLIQQVLEAGMAAPSAGNRQPWEFIVVQKDNELKRAIAGVTFRGNSWQNRQTQEWLLEAPVLIIVCGVPERSAARYGWDGAQKLLLQDTGAAIENMLLAATALGLASCWVGGFDMVALISLLHLPEFVPPIAILPLGYAARPHAKPAKLDHESLIRAWL